MLKELYLADNKIRKLPESFGELKKLQYLTLSRNDIRVMPESTERLTQLTQLNLGGNPLKPVPWMHLWERGDATIRLEGTQEKLRSVQAPRVEPTFGEDAAGTALKLELTAADERRLQAELDRVDREEKVGEWVPPGYEVSPPG